MSKTHSLTKLHLKNNVSTGGIIALGLTTQNWSVEECTRHFESLCREVFTKRPYSNLPGVSWLVENFNYSRYETRPMEDALRTTFSATKLLFGGTQAHTVGNDIKNAVTATSHTGQAVLFSNYNRICNEKCTPFHIRPLSCADVSSIASLSKTREIFE